MPSRHSGNLPQVLPLAKQNRVSTFSDMCVCTSAFICGKSSSDDFSPRLLLRKQKRSRTGAYAPPHFYAVNHRQMILVRGCYSIKLSGCQATVAVRHRFAQQNYLMLKRSQPLRSKPHIMRRNRLLTISDWGCYNTILMCRQGTAAICRKFCL